MDRRAGRVFSQSTSALNQVDDPNNTREGGGTDSGSHPARHSSHGAVASHFLAQSPGAYGGQTWMDFLRETGAQSQQRGHSRNPTSSSSAGQGQRRSEQFRQSIPGPRGSISDWQQTPGTDALIAMSNEQRKRRLTTPESPTRLPSNLRTRSGGDISNGDPSNAAGSSAIDPIVVDSSPILPTRSLPRPHLPSPNTSSRSSFLGRRESDIVLPPWQPDSEVSHCPVCGSQFTFFYRKHHCRKCGRVVCSACSPHRITIPRQFIVHPPSESPVGISIMDLTGENEDHSDPNNPHGNASSSSGQDYYPQEYRNPALGGGEEVRVCNPCVPDPNYSPPPQHLAHNVTPSPYTTLPSRPTGLPTPYRSDQERGESHFPRVPGLSGHRANQHQDHRESRPRRTTVSDLWPPTHNPSHLLSLPFSHSHSHSAGHAYMSNNAVLHDDNQRAFNELRRSALTAPPPRQIPEEDECPICYQELPPKGPNGDTAAREQHITACIAEQSGSQSPPVPGSSTTPVPATGAGGSSAPSASRSNRQSGLGLFAYTATEKDCLQDGEAVECEICFEDFSVGDRLARLSCWCRFHEHCIRGWFERKGERACPTHDLKLGGGA